LVHLATLERQRLARDPHALERLGDGGDKAKSRVLIGEAGAGLSRLGLGDSGLDAAAVEQRLAQLDGGEARR